MGKKLERLGGYMPHDQNDAEVIADTFKFLGALAVAALGLGGVLLILFGFVRLLHWAWYW